jgi:hypothetical protein
MVILRSVLRSAGFFFLTLDGVFLSTAFLIMTIVIPLTLLFNPTLPWEEVAILLLFFLPGAAFLNMANFFSRLKRVNSGVYAELIVHGHWFEHIARAGRSMLTNLDSRIATIASDQSGVLPHSIVTYAAATRYFNRLCSVYFVVVMLSMVGVAIYFLVVGHK